MWIIVEKEFQEIKPDFNISDGNQSFTGKLEVDREKTIENQENKIKSEYLDLKNIDTKRS